MFHSGASRGFPFSTSISPAPSLRDNISNVSNISNILNSELTGLPARVQKKELGCMLIQHIAWNSPVTSSFLSPRCKVEEVPIISATRATCLIRKTPTPTFTPRIDDWLSIEEERWSFRCARAGLQPHPFLLHNRLAGERDTWVVQRHRLLHKLIYLSSRLCLLVSAQVVFFTLQLLQPFDIPPSHDRGLGKITVYWIERARARENTDTEEERRTKTIKILTKDSMSSEGERHRT